MRWGGGAGGDGKYFRSVAVCRMPKHQHEVLSACLPCETCFRGYKVSQMDMLIAPETTTHTALQCCRTRDTGFVNEWDGVLLFCVCVWFCVAPRTCRSAFFHGGGLSSLPKAAMFMALHAHGEKRRPSLSVNHQQLLATCWPSLIGANCPRKGCILRAGHHWNEVVLWKGRGGGGLIPGRPGQRVEEQGTWAAQKHSEAGYRRPVDRGVWTAKTVKRPRQQPAHPQYANYWAPLTHKRHIPPHSAQSQHTNYWAPRTRKRHQQEHRPQRPTESSDPTQHAKGRTGDCPGPRKGTTTRRNVTQGG